MTIDGSSPMLHANVPPLRTIRHESIQITYRKVPGRSSSHLSRLTPLDPYSPTSSRDAHGNADPAQTSGVNVDGMNPRKGQAKGREEGGGSTYLLLKTHFRATSFPLRPAIFTGARNTTHGLLRCAIIIQGHQVGTCDYGRAMSESQTRS